MDFIEEREKKAPTCLHHGLAGTIYWHDIHYEIGGEVITYTYIAMQKYNTKTSQPRSMVTVAGPDSIQSRKK